MFPRTHLRCARRLAGTMLLVAGLVAPAFGSTYSVNPTQVVLSRQSLSRLVTIRNLSDEPLRFQVTAFRWGQSPQGEMILEPTRDVVAFPTLFSIAAGEQRTLRVGFTGTVGDLEATYRIFVEELPPASSENGGGSIRMLTRMGIPVFIQPKQPAGRVELSQVQLEGRRVSFALRNTGNVHVLPAVIRLRGMGRDGAITVEQEEKGWYVLAGGERTYRFELPPQACDGLSSLVARIQVADRTLEERLPAPLRCGD